MYNILQQVNTLENQFFCGLMFALFLISFVRITINARQQTTIPNVIAATGIIGTFLGIFLGLLKFDTVNIDKSIPILLDGMKTAFLTSLIGLTLSTILKSYQSFILKIKLKKEGIDNTRETSLETISELMLEIKESVIESNKILVEKMIEMNENDKKISKENRESMKNLVVALTGEEENSLVSQMRFLKDGMIKAQLDAQERLNLGLETMGKQLDNLVEANNTISKEIERGNNILIEEFRVFAKNMAENNMKAFTEAIQSCIKDLNNQLQEQFGENFKHLNIAVERLLEWQEHYKETVEKTNLTQEKLYEGMNQAKELVVEINNRSMSIVEIANKLGDKIVTFDTQQQVLSNSIEVLNKISLDSKELIPNLDTYLSKFNDNIINSTIKVEGLVEKVDFQIGESTKNIESHIKNVDSKLLEHTLVATDKITDHVISTTKQGIEEINKSSLNVLDKINLVNQEAINSIGKLSIYFKEESDKSIKNIEIIQKSVKDTSALILEDISEVSNEISNNINENNRELSNTRDQIKEMTKLTTENIRNQQNEIVESLEKLTKSFNLSSELNIKSMEDQISAFEKAIVRFENEGYTLTKRISDNIQVMVENNNKNLDGSINNINELLATTLNTSLQSLGEQLATVSEKFVSDYTPLTDELRKVVELAKRIGK